MATLNRPGVSLKSFLLGVWEGKPGHADILHAPKKPVPSTASLQFSILAVGGASFPVFDRAGPFQH